MDPILYDKNRRPIQDGDILKVFHFIGERRKKHYMYKMAGVYINKGLECADAYLVIYHLPHEKGSYYEHADGRILQDYEIVQGHDFDGTSFEDRKKKED